jgi:DNA adenine methylase
MARGASLMKQGENGKGLSSRWYPQTLARRVLDIHERRQRLSFLPGDGIAFIREHAGRKDTAWFIDPPYTVAGRRLYTHSDIDHRDLFAAAATIQGSFLMSYDNAGPVRELAREFGFDTQTVAMKNTHHAVKSELLIGRDLAWCR